MNKYIWVVFMVSFSLAACTRKKANKELVPDTTIAPPEVVAPDGTNFDNKYRNRASRMSARMATEMHFDTAIQAKVTQAYINHQRRLEEIRKRYNYATEENVNSGGTVSDSVNSTMNPRMITELQTIEVDLDNEFRNLLTPEQFKIYQTNRASYFKEDNSKNNSNQKKATK